MPKDKRLQKLSRNKPHLYWVAGILEGEGCFTLNRRRSPTSKRAYRSVNIAVNMTDLDVLQRLQKFAGGWLGTSRDRGRYKPIYPWLSSSNHAIQLAKLVRPLMCQRRRARITEVLAIDASERARAKLGRKNRAYSGALNQPRLCTRKRLVAKCHACGKPVIRKRSMFRCRKAFCSHKEYLQWLKTPGAWKRNRFTMDNTRRSNAGDTDTTRPYIRTRFRNQDVA